jgi:hypothetical protein
LKTLPLGVSLYKLLPPAGGGWEGGSFEVAGLFPLSDPPPLSPEISRFFIVLVNGEKISPVEIEMAINADRLFEQVIVVGEGRPYLTA